MTRGRVLAGGAGGANDENRFPLGPEAGETRAGATPFDNVSDYHLLNMPRGIGIIGIDGNPIAGLEQYEASVNVTNQALGAAVPATEALLIRVTVDGPLGTNVRVVLDGYRVRYAPNALP